MLQVFTVPRLSLISKPFLSTEYSWTDPVSLKPKVGQSINDLGIVDYRIYAVILLIIILCIEAGLHQRTPTSGNVEMVDYY
jgi:hypothetical protein